MMMQVSDLTLHDYLQTRGRLVDDALDRLLPVESQAPQIIHQAMRYCVFAGGKRLRPLLVLAGTEVCGGDPAHALPVACAVELIHTYSLIHDDLPAMDNSDLRHGRPACHVVFGEAIAVLTGDSLHALAFAQMANASDAVGAKRMLQVNRTIAEAIGTDGMVGGQVLDLLGEEGRTFPLDVSLSRRPSGEMVREIHLRKTGRLIRASLVSGAILAEADERTLTALGQYGERIGLAYQIVDDILDVTGEESALGKRLGSDQAHAKLTYPVAFGIDRSRQIAAELTADAQAAITGMGARARILRDLAEFLLRRER